MDSPTLIGHVQADFDHLLQVLTSRQYLAPHEPLGEALAHTIADAGVCPNAVAQSLDRLQLDPRRSIGRLRRTELMQLARTVHRYWRQAVESSQPRS